jgi:hypothetical protein
MHFCRGERPSQPRAYSIWVKYGEYSTNLCIILKTVVASCDTYAESNLEGTHTVIDKVVLMKPIMGRLTIMIDVASMTLGLT